MIKGLISEAHHLVNVEVICPPGYNLPWPISPEVLLPNAFLFVFNRETLVYQYFMKDQKPPEVSFNFNRIHNFFRYWSPFVHVFFGTIECTE